MDGIVERIIVFALVGLFSGSVSGLFGIGGASLEFPCLSISCPCSEWHIVASSQAADSMSIRVIIRSLI
jgi:uncharacterized membrane protein YfcA